jgi:hypothetical protein
MSTSKFFAKTVLPAPIKVIFRFDVLWIIGVVLGRKGVRGAMEVSVRGCYDGCNGHYGHSGRSGHGGRSGVLAANGRQRKVQ